MYSILTDPQTGNTWVTSSNMVYFAWVSNPTLLVWNITYPDYLAARQALNDVKNANASIVQNNNAAAFWQNLPNYNTNPIGTIVFPNNTIGQYVPTSILF